MKHHPAPLAAILAVTVLAGTLSSAANAESDRRQLPEKEEALGLMSGALIGAAAGGPPGVIGLCGERGGRSGGGRRAVACARGDEFPSARAVGDD